MTELNRYAVSRQKDVEVEGAQALVFYTYLLEDKIKKSALCTQDGVVAVLSLGGEGGGLLIHAV